MQKLREKFVESSSGKNHPGLVVWFTGLSGSGKSSLSKGLLALLKENGVVSFLLDGDIMRTGLCSDLGYSLEDRAENIRRVCEVSRLFSKAGVVTLVAMISPMRADRERVRSFFAPGEFVEIFVDAPLEVCEQRDVKGLYARARAGQIPDFTGISSPYEAPLRPELQVDTAINSYEASLKLVAERVLEFLPTVETP